MTGTPAVHGRRLALPLGLRGQLSDERLARAVHEGDQAAFEVLYKRFRDQLFRYCVTVLHQPQDAEEALQTTMVNAFRGLCRSGAGELKVRPWLYAIAHNACVSMLRQRRGKQTQVLSGDEHADGTPHDQAVRAEEVNQLWRDLAELSDGQRSALVLRELSGLSHEEIGAVLGEPAAAVKQIIYQARLVLHDMADGRAMSCEAVRERLSAGDGRVLRARTIRAHLRACEGCRAFREEIRARKVRLAALTPLLPAAVAERILGATLASGGAGAGAASLGAGVAGASVGVGLKIAAVATLAVAGAATVVPRGGTHAGPGPAASPARSVSRPAGGETTIVASPAGAALAVSGAGRGSPPVAASARPPARVAAPRGATGGRPAPTASPPAVRPARAGTADRSASPPAAGAVPIRATRGSILTLAGASPTMPAVPPGTSATHARSAAAPQPSTPPVLSVPVAPAG